MKNTVLKMHTAPSIKFLNIKSSFIFCLIPLHPAPGCPASPGAEFLLSSAPALLQLLSAHRTAVIVLAPHGVVHSDKPAVPAKAVSFAEKLDLVQFQVEAACNSPVSNSLQTHGADQFFLYFRHSRLLVSDAHTGLSCNNGIM